jgi:hypothetical protein
MTGTQGLYYSLQVDAARALDQDQIARPDDTIHEIISNIIQ